MKIWFVCALMLGLGACTYNAVPLTVTAASSEVRMDRRIDAPASVYLDPSIENLNVEAEKSSYTCSAHNYAIDAGPAIKGSLRSVIDESFRDASFRSSGIFDDDEAFDLKFRLDTFRPVITVGQGFWQGSASASTEIVLDLDVSYRGEEIYRSITIAGRGSSQGQYKGQSCEIASRALQDATQDALQRLTENFVYKVINPGDLADLVETRQ